MGSTLSLCHVCHLFKVSYLFFTLCCQELFCMFQHCLSCILLWKLIRSTSWGQKVELSPHHPPPPEKYNWPKHSGFSKWLWRATCSKFVFSWTVLFFVCWLSLRLLNVLCGLINCRDCMAELFEILRATILNYGLSLKWCATDLCLVYERWFLSGAIAIGSHPELFPGDFIFNGPKICRPFYLNENLLPHITI